MLKITVYIPSHNYGRFIGKAIESVQRQTTRDWELIVINDGSTDNTSEVVNRYRHDPKIRVIEQEKKGLSATNNIAIRLSNGRYIIRLDADDYFDENILQVLSGVLDSKPDVGLVYPDYYHIDESGNILEIIRRKKIGEDVELLDLPAHGAGTMIRKECLINLQGYEEKFSYQDGYEFWLKFIQVYKPYNVNLPLFYYRKHNSSLTTKFGEVLEARRKIKKHFVDRYHKGERPTVLGIVPVANESIYLQNRPFTKIGGKPLLWYTLNEVCKANNLDKVVLSTPDEEVLEYAKQFADVTCIRRPEGFRNIRSDNEDIYLHVLDELKQRDNYEPDAVCALYISTPFRKSHHIDKAIDTMSIFSVDSVISIQGDTSDHYVHGEHGLTPIGSSGLRFERDAVYKANGAIILKKVGLIRRREGLGENVGHIVMLPEESVKINSEYDLWLARQLVMRSNV